MLMPVEERFWGKVDKSKECWLWLGATTEGYGQFGIGRKNVHAHRFAYEVTYGKIPEGLFILHKCDNPSCVRPDHLFCGTNQENMQDAYDKGRGPNHIAVLHREKYYPSQKELWRQEAHPSVSYKTFIKRLKYQGWSFEEALYTLSYCGNKLRRTV